MKSPRLVQGLRIWWPGSQMDLSRSMILFGATILSGGIRTDRRSRGLLFGHEYRNRHMNIELEVYKPIECKSRDEAIGRASALSKGESRETFFVIHNTIRNIHLVQTTAPVWCNEKIIYSFYKGNRTFRPEWA